MRELAGKYVPLFPPRRYGAIAPHAEYFKAMV